MVQGITKTIQEKQCELFVIYPPENQQELVSICFYFCVRKERNLKQQEKTIILLLIAKQTNK